MLLKSNYTKPKLVKAISCILQACFCDLQKQNSNQSKSCNAFLTHKDTQQATSKA